MRDMTLPRNESTKLSHEARGWTITGAGIALDAGRRQRTTQGDASLVERPFDQ